MNPLLCLNKCTSFNKLAISLQLQSIRQCCLVFALWGASECGVGISLKKPFDVGMLKLKHAPVNELLRGTLAHHLPNWHKILVPKKSCPERISIYRLISLAHSFSKILANRLGPELDSLISTSQYAFIKNIAFMTILYMSKRS
jgi:hypothetical protein